MGVEQWDETSIQAYIHWEANDWFLRLLNPLYTSCTTPYTYYEIRSFIEIDPSTIRLPRWPDRAWSVIAETWEVHEETRVDRCALGMLMGTWYDHFAVVDLLAFDPLPGPFDAKVETLHQQLLILMNNLTSPPAKPMSQSSRKRWSQQVDYRGNPVFPLTSEEIRAIKRERGGRSGGGFS